MVGVAGYPMAGGCFRGRYGWHLPHTRGCAQGYISTCLWYIFRAAWSQGKHSMPAIEAVFGHIAIPSCSKSKTAAGDSPVIGRHCACCD